MKIEDMHWAEREIADQHAEKWVGQAMASLFESGGVDEPVAAWNAESWLYITERASIRLREEVEVITRRGLMFVDDFDRIVDEPQGPKCPCGWDPADPVRDHGGNGTVGEFLNDNGEPDYREALDHAIAVVEDFADWQENRPADEMLTTYRARLGRDLRQFAARLSANLHSSESAVVENESA